MDTLPPLAPGGVEPPGRPANAEESGVIPGYAWSMTPAGSLLARALGGRFDGATLERLCWEMVGLCNRELVVDQVDFANADAVKDSLRRVHAYANLGLEYVCDRQADAAESLLREHSLQTICQTGISLVVGLRQRANRVQTHLNRSAASHRALPGLAQKVLSGLLQSHAQFLSELDASSGWGYRDFLQLNDVRLVDGVLRELEGELFDDGAGSPDGPAPEMSGTHSRQ